MEIIAVILLGLGALSLFGGKSPKFDYKCKNGVWRAYFRRKPRNMSHVLYDKDGFYVCWTDPIYTENGARAIAKEWMRIYG